MSKLASAKDQTRKTLLQQMNEMAVLVYWSKLFFWRLSSPAFLYLKLNRCAPTMDAFNFYQSVDRQYRAVEGPTGGTVDRILQRIEDYLFNSKHTRH
jgi:hypothetical protein